jgi:hypothetical protein
MTKRWQTTHSPNVTIKTSPNPKAEMHFLKKVSQTNKMFFFCLESLVSNMYYVWNSGLIVKNMLMQKDDI